MGQWVLVFVLTGLSLFVGWGLGLLTATLGYSASVRDDTKRAKLIESLRNYKP